MPITKTEVWQLNLIAGAALNGGRLLMMVNGLVYYFDPTTESNYDRVVGFSTKATAIGEQVEILTEGPIEIGSLITDDTYWADLNGLITNSVPTSGILIRVGVAKSNSILEVNISEPIILA